MGMNSLMSRLRTERGGAERMGDVTLGPRRLRGLRTSFGGFTEAAERFVLR